MRGDELTMRGVLFFSVCCLISVLFFPTIASAEGRADPLYLEFVEACGKNFDALSPVEKHALFEVWEERLTAGIQERATHKDISGELWLSRALLRVYSYLGREEEACALVERVTEREEYDVSAKVDLSDLALMGARSRRAPLAIQRALLDLRQRALKQALSQPDVFSKEVLLDFRAKCQSAGFLRGAIFFHAEAYEDAIEEWKTYLISLEGLEAERDILSMLKDMQMDAYCTALAIAGGYLTIADKLSIRAGVNVLRLPMAQEAEGEEMRARAADAMYAAYQSADDWLAKAMEIDPDRPGFYSPFVKRDIINQARVVQAQAERLHVARRLGLDAEGYVTLLEQAISAHKDRRGENLRQALMPLQAEVTSADVFYGNRKQLSPETGYALQGIAMELAQKLSPDAPEKSSFYQLAVLEGLGIAIRAKDEAWAKHFLSQASGLPFTDPGTVAKWQRLQRRYMDKFLGNETQSTVMGDLTSAIATLGQRLGESETHGEEKGKLSAFLHQNLYIVVIALSLCCFVGAGLLYYLQKRTRRVCRR